MMNKYTLGTVLGTALIALAKSKMGSGVKLKKGYKQRLTGNIIFGLEEDVIDFDDNTMSKIKKTIESYGHGFVIQDISFFQDYQEDINYTYSSVCIEVYKDYCSWRYNPTKEIENASQFNTLLGNLKDKIENVIPDYYLDEAGFDDINTSNDVSMHPYIKDQSGEWVPYTSSTADSKLRKR